MNQTKLAIFLGARNIGDTLKVGNGGSINGPAILLACTSLFIFLKTNSECSEMLLEFFERIGSLVPEYWSLKPNFKPEINSFFLSARGYSINDFSTISAFIGEIPNE